MVVSNYFFHCSILNSVVRPYGQIQDPLPVNFNFRNSQIFIKINTANLILGEDKMLQAPWHPLVSIHAQGWTPEHTWFRWNVPQSYCRRDQQQCPEQKLNRKSISDEVLLKIPQQILQKREEICPNSVSMMFGKLNQAGKRPLTKDFIIHHRV